jgi:hypothetical protein
VCKREREGGPVQMIGLIRSVSLTLAPDVSLCVASGLLCKFSVQTSFQCSTMKCPSVRSFVRSFVRPDGISGIGHSTEQKIIRKRIER